MQEKYGCIQAQDDIAHFFTAGVGGLTQGQKEGLLHALKHIGETPDGAGGYTASCPHCLDYFIQAEKCASN